MSQRRTIVITGAGAGIGRALAAAFTRDGWSVAGIGRSADNLHETGALCAEGTFEPVVADVVDHAAVGKAMAGIESRLGPLEALVCAAAVYPHGYFLDQDAGDWDRTLLINVSGVANCCRAVLPGMLARNHGRIVILGSLADETPAPGSGIYSVSKGALHSFTRSLASEIDRVRYPDVLVNEYLPRATRTRMSPRGDDPASLYPWIRALVELPSGGPTGRAWRQGKEHQWNRSPQAMARRLAFKLLGQR